MKLYLKTKDFSVTHESFELYWDSEFDMLSTQPQPKNLSRYYESKDYISHTDANRTFADKLYQWVKRRNLKNKIQIVDNQKVASKSLLDFGAGTGDFVLRSRSSGYNAVGIEPNHGARTLAKKKGAFLFADWTSLPSGTFQVICLWHVLEHLPNLDEEVDQIVSRMDDSGILVIAVPNFKSFDAKHYGRYWAGFDVPRHLWHFSRDSIEKLFEKHNLEVTKTHPMWFDAFYVSMLSEKYKGNKLHLFSAFLVGLWSNLKACFTKEYSSIIYVLKRKNN